jgi:hypothetical protein
MVIKIPNVGKIFQIALKFINIFPSKAPQNLPKFGFLVWKETIWQLCIFTTTSDLGWHFGPWGWNVTPREQCSPQCPALDKWKWAKRGSISLLGANLAPCLWLFFIPSGNIKTYVTREIEKFVGLNLTIQQVKLFPFGIHRHPTYV